MLVQCPALAGAHGDMPGHTRSFWPLDCTKVAGIRKHHRFFTVQQAMTLRHVAGIGRCADDGMHQARLCVHANVRLHAKVPLVAFLGLVHFGVTLAGTILGGIRCRNQSGVHHRAGLEQQAVESQLGVDHLQDLRAQLVRLEKMAKSQDADAVGDALGAADAGEVTVEVGLEQSLFGSQVGQPKPLLQAVNAQPLLPDQTADVPSWPPVRAG